MEQDVKQLIDQLAQATLALDMVDQDIENFGEVTEDTINVVRQIRGAK